MCLNAIECAYNQALMRYAIANASYGSELAVLSDFRNQFLKHLIRPIVFDLTGARIGMAAAAIVQHQFPNVGVRSAIEDGFTHGKNCILLL